MKTAKTITRDRLVRHLDRHLDVANIPDSSPNGLQVQGNRTVTKLAFAVDASVQTIRAAVTNRANMLIVHHGLFWGIHKQIVGNMHKRVSLLIENNVSLYAAHLPLDCHPEIGNNVELVRILGLENLGRFADYHGVKIGILARTEKSLPRNKLLAIIDKALDARATLLPFGPSNVRRIGVISGDAAEFTEEARRCGCDTLVTGESSHSAYHHAREAGINLVFGGHYATETIGLKALHRHLSDRFSVPGKFIPAPTGL